MKKILLAVSLLSVLSVASLRGEDKIASLLSEMEKTDNAIKALSFSFTQEISYTLTGEKQNVAGEIVFSKPDSFNFKQSKPMIQTIVANKKKVWIYTPSYNQVVTDTWRRWANNGVIPNSITTFSSGWSEMKKKYIFSYGGEDAQFYILNLKPKKKEAFSWAITMWVDRKDFCPRKMLLVGENIRISTVCENYKINPALDLKMFNFVPPSGVDIIEMP